MRASRRSLRLIPLRGRTCHRCGSPRVRAGAPPRTQRVRCSAHVPALAIRRRAINAMLRVDHAGETAAVRIYEGQRAVLCHTAEAPLLAEMAEHERAHLDRFQRLVRLHANATPKVSLKLARSFRSIALDPARCCRFGRAPRTRWVRARRCLAARLRTR